MKVDTEVKAGRGLGDVVADFTKATGLDKLAEKYEEVTGKECGCRKRRETLNRLVPLD